MAMVALTVMVATATEVPKTFHITYNKIGLVEQ